MIPHPTSASGMKGAGSSKYCSGRMETGYGTVPDRILAKAPVIFAEIWYTFRGHPVPGKVYE